MVQAVAPTVRVSGLLPGSASAAMGINAQLLRPSVVTEIACPAKLSAGVMGVRAIIQTATV